MKTGITFDLFSQDYACFGEKRYQKIKSHGYECLDFNLMDTETVFYGKDFEKEIKREKEKIDSAGLTVFQTHGPWRWPPQDGAKEDRTERQEKFKKAIISTAILGAKYMVGHPIMPYGIEDVGQDFDECFKLNVDFWGELALFGKKHGVTVCIENMPMPNFTLATPYILLRLVEKIGGDNIGICLDTGHVNVIKDLKIGEIIEKLGDKLKVLHVHDNDGLRDTHLYPFSGTFDWKSFTRALRETKFSGVMNLETHLKNDLEVSEYEDECLRLANIAKTLASLSFGE